MREIKFRYWDSIDASWCCEEWLRENSEEVLFGWLNLKDIPKEIHVMQYTGLKDKNDKEIYEGDIVKHREGGYTVVWNDGASKVGEHDDKWGDHLGWYLYKENTVDGCYDEWIEMCSDMIYEVTGNVYEVL